MVRLLKQFIVLLVFLCVLMCSNISNMANAEPLVQQWKIASLAPAGVGWALYIDEVLMPLIKEATGGHLKLDWFWGGSKGDEEDYIKQMISGDLQGMGFSGAGFVMACPEASVIELPFLFNNYDEVDYIKEKMRDDFDALCEKRGYKFIYWVDQGFDKIYSTSTRIYGYQYFKNARFLTWYGPMEKGFLEYFGASPVKVDVPDININIISGVCDSFIAPSTWIVGSMLYTKIKYIHAMPVRYSPGGLMVTLEAWNSLPDIYKKSLIKERYREKEFNKKLRKTNSDFFNAMIAYGIEEVKLNPEEDELLRLKSKQLWHEFAGRFYPAEILEKILRHLDDYRAEQK